MVQQQFENVDIQCWEHSANKRFGVRPPFICLKAGPEACAVMLNLLDELGGLQPPGQRSMTLAPSDRREACSKIRFVISPVSDELFEMSFTRKFEIATFEFTPTGLMIFRKSVGLWQEGKEDFSVHPTQYAKGIKDRHSGEVWFWTPFTDP